MASVRRSQKSVFYRLSAQVSLWIPLAVVALFIIIPVVCSIDYAIFPGGHFSLSAYDVLFSNDSLAAALIRTLLVVCLTIVVLIGTLVPAVVAVHLWAPKLRPFLEIMCTLPLVVPPIALAAGIVALLRWAGNQGRFSVADQISQFFQNPNIPLILVGSYVVLCLPFTFRSIDSGLRTISLKAMVEGSASLGSNTWGTVWRVVIPNIRGPVLFSIFFTIAVSLSEFAIAATLSYQTVSVWLYTVSATDFRSSIAVSVLLNIVTWLMLLVATLCAGRFSKSQ